MYKDIEVLKSGVVICFLVVFSIIFSRQPAFTGIAEHVRESGAGCCGNGSSTACSPACICRRWCLFANSCRSSASCSVISWADFFSKSILDVTAAEHTAQTTTRCVRQLLSYILNTSFCLLYGAYSVHNFQNCAGDMQFQWQLIPSIFPWCLQAGHFSRFSLLVLFSGPCIRNCDNALSMCILICAVQFPCSCLNALPSHRKNIC